MFKTKGLKTTFKIIHILLLMVLLFILPELPTAGAEDDSSKGVMELETITVTAQKREEDVQKVTTSITVLSDTIIEDSGIESTEDIWRYVPNLYTSHEGSRDYFYRIKIRGISNTAYGDPATALYIDDVPYAGVYAFNSPMFDIERIEVLKGPQGTLYGKSTEGGTINIITKSPDNNINARINVEMGDYKKRQTSGVINLPFVEDKLYLRLAGLYSSRDGYIKNIYKNEDVDSQETRAAKASLLFKPNDKLLVDLKFRLHEYDDKGGYPEVPMDKEAYGAVTGLKDLDKFEIGYDYTGKSSSKTNSTSLRLRYQQKAFDIISVTAHRDMENTGWLDPDYTPLPMYFGYQTVESENITQEFRVQSRALDTSFKWLVGLYYSKEDKAYDCEIYLDTIYAERYGVPLYTAEAFSADLGGEDQAIFGQTTVRFLDDALGLTAGLRYERSKRLMDNKVHTFAGAAVVDEMDNMENTDSLFLPKFAIDYFINDTIMTYASIAKGYKSGGFAYAVDNVDLVDFEPEVSTAYELGIKTEFPKLGLRINAAGFFTRVDDYQDRVQLDPLTVYQENVTETDIYGFELEVAYKLTDNWAVSGFIGYTHAEYGEYIDPMTRDNYKGNLAVNVPEYDSGLFLEYRNLYGIFARAEMQNIGSSYFDRANIVKQDAYTLFNMKIGYEQESWGIYLAVKNLTDEQYFLTAYEDATVGWVGPVGAPRTFVAALSYRY